MKLSIATKTALLLPLIALVFAYLELGGNWFAYRMIERQTIWSVGGTAVFATAYSFIAASIAKWRNVDLGLLMVNYGFGFSIMSLILKLKWNKIPEPTLEHIQDIPMLLLVLAIALVAFVMSAWFVVTTEREEVVE